MFFDCPRSGKVFPRRPAMPNYGARLFHKTRWDVLSLRTATIALITAFGLQPPLAPCADESLAGNANPRSRSFSFICNTMVTGLSPGKVARIWLPVPPSDEDQQVQIASNQLPGKSQIATEPKFGNRILYVEAVAGADGKISLS